MEHRDVLPLSAMAISQHEHIRRYMGGDSQRRPTVDDTVGVLAGAVIAATGALPWMGVIEADGVVVGRVWLLPVPLGAVQDGAAVGVDPTVAEIGYWISEQWCGRGIGTSAVRQAVAVAFDHLGLESVVARVQSENAPSRRVLEQVGFVAGEQEGDWISVRIESVTSLV